MDVLVTGGTGYIGRRLCAELHERGHDVTALARRPDESVLPDGVETARGDVTEYASIVEAFDGRDAVVNLVALSPLYRPRGGEDRHLTVHLGGTKNVVEAAEARGVDRLVQMSGIRADPEGPTAHLRAKGKAEEVVHESDLGWVIFRPAAAFGDGGEFVPFTRSVTTPYVTGLPGGGKTRFQPIWVEEIVPMIADGVEADEHLGEVYELGGPEVLTLAEVAKLIHRAEGRSLRIVPVPMPLARLGMSLAAPIPFVPFGPDQYRSLKLDLTTPENDVESFGVRPDELTTLAEYLEGI